MRTRRPKLLPKCGHSLCSGCLDPSKLASGFKCPIDSIKYPPGVEISDNLLILDTLSNAPAKEEKICSKHKKELEIYCLNCCKEVCANCLLFDDHKNHNYESLAEAKQKCEQKIRKMKQQIQELRSKLDGFSEHELGLRQIEREAVDSIRKKFEEFREELHKAELSAVEKVRGVSSDNFAQAKGYRQRLEEVSKQLDYESTTVDTSSLSKTLDQISFFCQSDPRRFKREAETKLNLVFDTSMYKNLANFCSLGDSKRRDSESPIPESYLSTPLVKSQRPNLLAFKIDAPRAVDSPFRGEHSHSRSILNLSQMASPSHSVISRRSLVGLSTSGMPGSFKPAPLTDSIKKSTLLKENEPEQKIVSPRLLVSDKINLAVEQVILGKTFTFDVSNLSLSEQTIEGIAPKIRALTGAKTFKMCSTGLKDNGLRKILKGIEKLNVEFLFLTNNSLSEAALEYLISFSKYNSNLRNVYLNSNSINRASLRVKTLIKALESKNIIVSL